MNGDVPLAGDVAKDYAVFQAETKTWRESHLRVFPALGNHEFHGDPRQDLENAAFSEGPDERKIWGALLSLMASRDQVGCVWDNWLSERLKRHSKTDSRIELRVVRLAADGVWFERIMNAKSKNLKGVEEYLIEMTRTR
jgi:Tetracyclin repressor-like, C-terminal domain